MQFYRSHRTTEFKQRVHFFDNDATVIFFINNYCVWRDMLWGKGRLEFSILSHLTGVTSGRKVLAFCCSRSDDATRDGVVLPLAHTNAGLETKDWC